MQGSDSIHKSAHDGPPAPGGFSGNPAPGLSCTVRIICAANFLLAFATAICLTHLDRAVRDKLRLTRCSCWRALQTWLAGHTCSTNCGWERCPNVRKVTSCEIYVRAPRGPVWGRVLSTPAVLSWERAAPPRKGRADARRRAPRHATERAPLLDPNTQSNIITPQPHSKRDGAQHVV